MADFDRTIGPSDHYSTIQGFLNAVDGLGYSPGDDVRGLVQSDFSAGSDTADFSVIVNTDVSSVQVIGAEGQRHQGDVGVGARFVGTGAFTFRRTYDYVERVGWLEIDRSGSGGGLFQASGSTAGKRHLDHCLVHSMSVSVPLYCVRQVDVAHNNVIWGCTTSDGTARGIEGANAARRFYNSLYNVTSTKSGTRYVRGIRSATE